MTSGSLKKHERNEVSNDVNENNEDDYRVNNEKPVTRKSSV